VELKLCVFVARAPVYDFGGNSAPRVDVSIRTKGFEGWGLRGLGSVRDFVARNQGFSPGPKAGSGFGKKGRRTPAQGGDARAGAVVF